MRTPALQSRIIKPRTLLLLSLAAGLLLALYIFQVNAMTALVYRLGDQERSLQEMKASSVALESLHVPSLSRVNMEALARDLRFERVKNISYLRVPSSAVARTGALGE